MTPNDLQGSRDTTHNWTDALPQTDHVDFFINVNWAKTPLGALQQWPSALRMYTDMVMSDSRAACLYWGPTQIAIYNASFVPLAAGAHPRLMGQPFAVGFPELEPFMRPLFDEAIRSGDAQDVVEAPMMVERNNYTEEAFFTGNFNPLRGMDGEVVALYNALFEVTRQKIHDRRKDMLNMLTTPESLSTGAVYSHIIASLATDPHDVSMAVLYEAHEDTASGKTKLHARGQLGVPGQHALTLGEQDLDATIGIMPMCKKSMDGRVVFEPGPLFDGVQWRGFNHAPKQVVTMSLRTQSRLFGFLTIGTNPFRPFDESCEQFIQDLSGTASNLLAAALDADTLRRDQQQLRNDLQFSNMKVRHLVDHASVGMAHAKPDGELLWANDKFFTLASPSSGKADALQSIFGLFSSDDQEKAREVWTRVFDGEEHVSADFRLKQSYRPPVGDSVPAQIQLLAFPFREHGVPVSGMVCVTDISHLKWAESWQARIAQDARDAKRQQEAFIDTVSHEVRNPLSAIVHCADSILLAFDDIHAKEDMSKISSAVFDVLKDNTAAASVILDCCKHQKRIVDDVLTLSRLDSSLLSVKPTAIKPAELVDSVMAMFSAELRSKAINTRVIAEPSIRELDVNHLQLDSSRVVQIFINLLTNAIKFMDTKTEKELSIRYGATRSPPRSGKDTTSFPAGVHWASKGRKAADDVDSPVWGTGEVLYLTFYLSDTGIGMRQEEVGKVFERFEQANITTHVTYGGSGLGLTISKELTERMAGEIGVMSELDKGSTFVFYIKTRRAAKQAPSTPLISPLPLRQVANGIEASVPPSSAQKLRTLLVEDNIVNQKALTRLLTRHNIAVTVANHGLEALETIRTCDIAFDVTLMDMQMPVMDGITCIREIRRLEHEGLLKGRMPIIAVTANARHAQIESAIDAGADRVVQKPYKAKELVDLMREITWSTGSEGAKAG